MTTTTRHSTPKLDNGPAFDSPLPFPVPKGLLLLACTERPGPFGQNGPTNFDGTDHVPAPHSEPHIAADAKSEDADTTSDPENPEARSQPGTRSEEEQQGTASEAPELPELGPEAA